MSSYNLDPLKVSGAFGLTPMDTADDDNSTLDLSHVIYTMTFGRAVDTLTDLWEFAPTLDMLAGATVINNASGVAHEYALSLVPASFRRMHGPEYDACQYNYDMRTRNVEEEGGVRRGIWFR